jgi:hypothetical protein
MVQAGGLETAVWELPMASTREVSEGRCTRSEAWKGEADQAKGDRGEVRSKMQEARRKRPEARGAVKRGAERRTR